jgi:hypothetical protein
MKANLKFIGSILCVVIPPMDSLFPAEEVEANPEKFAMPIYKLEKITNTDILKEGKQVEGSIIRENKRNYFVLKNAQYIQDTIFDENNSRTIAAVKAIMGNFEHTAITPDQYTYLHNLAKSENLISSYLSNGFCIYWKYVVYGKKTNDGKIIYPQIKIKSNKK